MDKLNCTTHGPVCSAVQLFNRCATEPITDFVLQMTRALRSYWKHCTTAHGGPIPEGYSFSGGKRCQWAEGVALSEVGCPP